MSLQFIIGRAGSGKSTLLYKNLIDTSMNNPDKNILAVVSGAIFHGNSKADTYND